MTHATLIRLAADTDGVAIGGKARHVRWLLAHGEKVPHTWVVPIGAGPPAAAELSGHLDTTRRFAVRSSADVEDGVIHSFAGQFLTELDVTGADEIARAIAAVQGSATSSRVAEYLDHVDGGDHHIGMAVMVQDMIAPAVSGVAFSRNPITGLNEVVIEAVAGRGDALVGEGVTPERWIRRWGDWTTRPAAPVLPAAVAEEVAAITARIATSFGYPVDLEWVWDGTDVWWVQLRPITGLADVNVYSSRISREVMPGIIKPLVWSVNVPMVNRAWIDLFTEFIGANELEPGDLAKSFAYRSYFNMSAIGDVFELLGMPRDSLELLLGLPAGSEQPSFAPSAKTMRLLPRLLVAAVRKAAFGRKVPAEVATLQARFGRYDRGELTEMTDEALLLAVDELIETGTRAAYANIVTPLLANLYHGLLRRNLGKSGLDAERVDVGAHSHAQLDPNRGLDRLAAGVAALPDVERRRIEEHGRDALPADLDAEFADFLDAFGHLSDSGNDFSVPPWRENPDHVLDLVLQHVATIGTATRVPWEDAIATVGVLRRPLTGFLRSRTVAFMGHRDAVSSMYTYGYGLLRRYFLEAGRRLVSRGLLEDPDDVMYLTHAEVRAGLTGLGAPPDLRTISAHHRAEIAAVADLVMPDVIYGDDFVASPPAEAADRLVGIPSSRGRHRGVLRIVRGIEDFGRVLPGDVIAIPFSDVGWTPLFARAGAVIAEAGGMLSHSSIVAREYQIPCIVSVAGATTLPDGVEVFVDGYSGEVIVERGQS